ncbi:MAG: ABC transporter permease [Planctomicrobium sp.]|jgi:tungstate transport system permease protein|nr:ABC transporter permease [Planctomicrobium sp.]
MELIWDGLREAFRLLVLLDELVFDAALRSVWISILAVGLSAIVGLPIGIWLARTSIVARNLIVFLFRAGMALPTVFIGIVCYALISRRGPLGPFDLLYTPWAIVCGECMLALPLIVSHTHGAIRSLDPRVAETARTLGANGLRRWRTYVSEARIGVLLGILTAFSRCVTELGIAMMVGGNLKDRTRTLATAAALETGKGEFARGLAMGLILLTISLVITALVIYLSREEKHESSR